jgi:hypothetical protein
MSWEHPERKNMGGGEAQIYEAQKNNVEANMKA